MRRECFQSGYGLGPREVDAAAEVIEQWVHGVLAVSSEYDPRSYAATNIIGEPRVYPQYGDISGTWAQRNCGSAEFVEITYPKAVLPKSLELYETFNPGALVKVEARDANEIWHTVWTGPCTVGDERPEARLFTVKLDADFATDRFKLTFDCRGKWCEIDAIRLRGEASATTKEPAAPDGSLSSDLLEALRRDEPTDTVIACSDGAIAAHRFVLGARSPFLRARLTDRIHLDEVPREVMLPVVEFLYSDKGVDHATPDELVVPIFSVAKLLGVSQLMKTSAAELARRLRVDNVCGVLSRVAVEHPELKDVCLTFVAAHAAEVVHGEEFASLPAEVLVAATRAMASKSQSNGSAGASKVWKVGDRPTVSWNGRWFPAVILEMKGSLHKIRYDGYDASWDEWVENARMR